MRILIDECLDWRLGRALTGHDCVSVQKMGWGGIKNGRLLALAQAEFDQGMVGLGVVGYQNAEFDNFKVDPVN